MACITCGSSEFAIYGGITYCTECSTQVEETRHEVRDDDQSLTRKSLLTTTPTVKTSPIKGEKKTHGTWIMAEAYNVIIYKQVSALIKLGASPKLKPTVLHIWSQYLQKCEVAFRKDYRAAEGVPRLGTRPTKRDLAILHGDTLSSKKRKRMKEEHNTSNTHSTSDSYDSASDTQDSTSDNQSSDIDSNSSSISKKSKIKYSSHALKRLRKGKINLNVSANQLFNMNLPKTLSFCYLGLLYTQDHLSLLDFIRFVKEERIPYINIIDKLPSPLHSRFHEASSLLTYAVPDAHSIHKMACNLAKFLNLPKFSQPPLYLAVARYVKELNLPDDMLPMVNVLIKKFDEVSSKFLCVHADRKPHDYVAAAFIIIILKMLFVLDDKYEIEHSKVITKLNQMKPEHKYFVWTEWKQQALLKDFLFVPENPWFCSLHKVDSLSVDRIISKYPYTVLKYPSNTDSRRHQILLGLKHEVKNMLAKVTCIPNKSESESTSFPLKSKINALTEEWRTLKMYQETNDIDSSVLRKDFSSHSLVFNPVQFSTEDELNLLLSSLYLPEESKEMYLHPFPVSQSKPVSQYITIRTSSEYWFLDSKKRVSSDALLDWMHEVPSSFRWLITYICKYACLKYSLLYQQITLLEKLLFLRTMKVRNNKPEK